jgi:hypothetical protein
MLKKLLSSFLFTLLLSVSSVSGFTGTNLLTLRRNCNSICAVQKYPQRLQTKHASLNAAAIVMTNDVEKKLQLTNKIRGILFDIDGTLFHSDPGKDMASFFIKRFSHSLIAACTVHFEVFKVILLRPNRLILNIFIIKS